MKDNGTYRFEITDSHKYCENVYRHHKANHIYFIVDPVNRTFFQNCYDPDCQGFRSRSRPIIKGQSTVVSLMTDNTMNQCPCCLKRRSRHKQTNCGTCAKLHCYQCLSECYLCHGSYECSRCRERCSDAYGPS